MGPQLELELRLVTQFTTAMSAFNGQVIFTSNESSREKQHAAVAFFSSEGSGLILYSVSSPAYQRPSKVCLIQASGPDILVSIELS